MERRVNLFGYVCCIPRAVIPNRHLVTWTFQTSSIDSGVINNRKGVRRWNLWEWSEKEEENKERS